MMINNGLSALLLLGNGAIGTVPYDCFRYLVDNKTFYYIQAAIVAPGREAISLASTLISQLEFINKSFVKNCRIAPDPIEGIIDVFRDLEITSGKVGTILEIFPASWYLQIQQAFPQIEFVDVSEPIYKIRCVHSAEEVEIFKKCAELADIGYKTACDTVRVGMTERELVSELEYAVQRNGGEDNFTLITSGKYDARGNKLPFLHSADTLDKVIEKGDTVVMKIAPRCNGYWAKLARALSMGEPSEELSAIHKLALGAIQDVLPELRPGNPISAIPKRIKKFFESAGYGSALPCGHVCGLNLYEEPLIETNHRLLIPGMAVVIHPSVTAPEYQNGIFWGETYLITEKGCDKITTASDELMIIR